MQRKALTISTLLGLFLAWTASARAQETITYLDRKTGKEAQVTGLIQSESAAGITLKQGTMVQTIPATDIVFVLYKITGMTDVVFKTPNNKEKSGLDTRKTPKERREFLAESVKEAETLMPRLREHAAAYRFMQYKIALVRVHQAREEPGRMDAALAALNEYRKEHTTGWEIVPCLKLLAQLQEESGDIKAAQETYKELRVLPGVPKELVMESNILISNLLIRSKKYDEAEKTLQEVRLQLADIDPQRPMILVYLCQAQMMQGKTGTVEKDLQSAINDTSDPIIRGLAHNTLGDYYRQKSQEEEAFWHYLRVDVLYPVNREEHAKSLYWLSKLFDSVKKDKGKALECAEKLKAKEYETTEFARRLATEK